MTKIVHFSFNGKLEILSETEIEPRPFRVDPFNAPENWLHPARENGVVKRVRRDIFAQDSAVPGMIFD